jgi:Chalcone isomerase-like
MNFEPLPAESSARVRPASGWPGRRLTAILAMAMAALAWSPFAQAAPDCRVELPSAQLSGSGELHLFGFHLYDAQLWSARLPVSYDARFALLLTYTHAVTRERLAQLGIDEMKRLAASPIPDDQIEQWHHDMLASFVDIAPGDQLCGVFLPGQGVRFFANGKPTATIDDVAFARAFFGIWLDPRTQARALREQLLGGSWQNGGRTSSHAAGNP